MVIHGQLMMILTGVWKNLCKCNPLSLVHVYHYCSPRSVEYPNERKLKKWACSLDDMLMDVTGRFNFEAFCKKHYCCENIRFWEALQDLQMLPLEAVPSAVTMIYE